MNKINLETIENTNNSKYMNLFTKPTYEAIEEEKIIRKAEERRNAKRLVKHKKSNGFISPLLLGIMISFLVMVGMIIAHITYLVS